MKRKKITLIKISDGVKRIGSWEEEREKAGGGEGGGPGGVMSRPFFSDFVGRANRALSSQFYRARRQNSEPGKKTMLDGRLPILCLGGQG